MPSSRTFAHVTLVLTVLVVLAGCGGPSSAGSAPPPAIEPGTVGTVELDERPFALQVPDDYDPATPVPLVVGLHGYTSDGKELAGYLGLTGQADEQGFLLAMPEGTTNSESIQFWNATGACCDFEDSKVDDSAYLSQLISTVQEQYAVDPEHVAVVGHSNGGFMALRMACEHADQITTAVSVSGAMTPDTSSCTPAEHVSVLQIHGSADEVIAYDGGNGYTGDPYPGADETVKAWRTLDACSDSATKGDAKDLEALVNGAETEPVSWAYADGSEVALWKVRGARHVPAWTPQLGADLADWMLTHGRDG